MPYLSTKNEKASTNFYVTKQVDKLGHRTRLNFESIKFLYRGEKRSLQKRTLLNETMNLKQEALENVGKSGGSSNKNLRVIKFQRGGKMNELMSLFVLPSVSG